MNLGRSSQIALWIIAISLVYSQVKGLRIIKLARPIENNQVSKNTQINSANNEDQLISMDFRKTIVKSKQQLNIKDLNNTASAKTVKDNRYKRRAYLIKNVEDRAKEVCTSNFLRESIDINIKNQLLLMNQMENMIPNQYILDWEPYTREDMKELITVENCLNKYLEKLLPYAEELEVDSFKDLLVKEPNFIIWYQYQFSWAPNWPDCPQFGYPACKEIEPEKWEAISKEKEF